jgi:metal-sulfur cluster biosynthetic enzyme
MTATVELPAAAPAREEVLAALARVRDPELDEPITDLQFVQDVRLAVGRVEVDLRLPTYFCAPNFAYLMVADAYDELAGLPGVGEVAVQLLDHFASEEINAGVSGGRGFAGSFPGLADGELAQLRADFRHKAHRALQERVAAALLRGGLPMAELAGSTLADALPGADLDRLVRRRRELGLPCEPEAALLLHEDGRPISAADLPTQLRFARTTRVSIEGNATFCRGLLSVRYDLPRSG